MVRTEDSSIFVGDEDKTLSKYDTNFNFISSLLLKSPVQCAVALSNNLIAFGLLNKYLVVLDSNLSIIKEIKLKSVPLKIIFSEDRDHLIVA